VRFIIDIAFIYPAVAGMTYTLSRYY